MAGGAAVGDPGPALAAAARLVHVPGRAEERRRDGLARGQPP